MWAGVDVPASPCPDLVTLSFTRTVTAGWERVSGGPGAQNFQNTGERDKSFPSVSQVEGKYKLSV